MHNSYLAPVLFGNQYHLQHDFLSTSPQYTLISGYATDAQVYLVSSFILMFVDDSDVHYFYICNLRFISASPDRDRNSEVALIIMAALN